ncbi:uncharacterized protein LOC118309066 isoform X1 [Scophthalmus maximus]|uniref:uncharacterized protein LOC118309066 isoform X1 n=2 Tax=Scophthalmus maximus TaxID=52904 RepID=UPI001FA8B3DE|nr:uncharacterized protein LOC118309066 isoform X1 [Scophthalmus maximus]XP_035486586.2 uncharacterized protein LOC118309066 isoform X1 [Scophthalmus maximus]
MDLPSMDKGDSLAALRILSRSVNHRILKKRERGGPPGVRSGPILWAFFTSNFTPANVRNHLRSAALRKASALGPSLDSVNYCGAMLRSFASYLDWSRRMSSSSEEQRHLDLKEVAQAVIRPLKSGLHSFNNVLEMLLRVNADIVLPDSQTFRDIRQEIENMKQRMEESEQVARRELQQLDGETEHLTAEQSRLVNQKRQKELKIEGLKIQLESHRSSLESYKGALERERDNLKSAENTRDRMRDRRDTGETVRNVGIGVTLIPIVGWVAGPIMIVAGEHERSMASDAVDSANREIENCESQVSSYSQKVSEYNSSICQAQREIQEADNKIREVEATLRSVAVKREAVSNVQQKMRCAVHQLGKLCGVGNVAELQTKRLILFEPMVKVMEEMTTALSQIAGNELLHTEGINSLMWDISTHCSSLPLTPASADLNSLPFNSSRRSTLLRSSFLTPASTSLPLRPRRSTLLRSSFLTPASTSLPLRPHRSTLLRSTLLTPASADLNSNPFNSPRHSALHSSPFLTPGSTLHTESRNSLMWEIKEKQKRLNQLVATNMSIDDDDNDYY